MLTGALRWKNNWILQRLKKRKHLQGCKYAVQVWVSSAPLSFIWWSFSVVELIKMDQIVLAFNTYGTRCNLATPSVKGGNNSSIGKGLCLKMWAANSQAEEPGSQPAFFRCKDKPSSVAKGVNRRGVLWVACAPVCIASAVLVLTVSLFSLWRRFPSKWWFLFKPQQQRK